jgi:hypothetical protein
MSLPISNEVKLFCATLLFLMALHIAEPFIQIFIFRALIGDPAKLEAPAFRADPELRSEKL